MEDKTARILDELISAIKDVAPEIWAIVIRQVHAEIAFYIVWIITIIFVLYLFYLWFKKLIRQGKQQFDNDKMIYNLVWVLSVGIALFPSLFLVDCIANVIMRLVNIEYYAIKLLLGMI